MATETWEPASAALPDVDDLKAAAAVWRAHGGDDPDVVVLDEQLEPALRERLRAAMQAPAAALAEAIAGLDDADAMDLARLLTVLEARPGFEAGARSPVVPIFRHLKARLDADALTELARWIRAHTENRFIPHGSLRDRLRA
ncbi:MAG: hypothetical protein V2J24_18340 [Pseudomonadales bacterium]|nr:hypothetical protein [Pseudomonadales bacterium]